MKDGISSHLKRTVTAMDNFASWVANHRGTVFYMWVKSTKINGGEYQKDIARTIKIVDAMTTNNGDYIGVVNCDTFGKVYNKYIEYYALSEVRLGIPDFDYENTHERGDIK